MATADVFIVDGRSDRFYSSWIMRLEFALNSQRKRPQIMIDYWCRLPENCTYEEIV